MKFLLSWNDKSQLLLKGTFFQFLIFIFVLRSWDEKHWQWSELHPSDWEEKNLIDWWTIICLESPAGSTKQKQQTMPLFTKNLEAMCRRARLICLQLIPAVRGRILLHTAAGTIHTASPVEAKCNCVRFIYMCIEVVIIYIFMKCNHIFDADHGNILYNQWWIKCQI